MDKRQIFTTIIIMLALTAVVSIVAMSWWLYRVSLSVDREDLYYCFQIVIFAFTGALGLTALIQFVSTTEAEMARKRWEKLNYLEARFEKFQDHHEEILKAFEWPHLLRETYLPLCVRALEYDNAVEQKREAMMTEEEMEKIRRLDDFLEYFENSFFALDQRLLKVDDFLIFMQYNLLMLGDAYHNPDGRLKLYIDRYYFNIQRFLDEVAAYFEKHPDRFKKDTFKYFPLKKQDTSC